MSKIYKTNLYTDLQKYFKKSTHPISALDIISKFTTYNKSTIYRQIEKLIKIGFLKNLDLDINKISYYEKNTLSHSHLVCQKCNQTICFDLEKQSIKDEIYKQYLFAITDINIIGTCKNCLSL